ncbi:IclR family transcriptional regulator C-terminal domain-containing protein [Pseudonocardia lutea]|uniref:IclR family transcriptional regulator C-terminal domain-containing protein n=1 Tax=Pseudonocardia lutea TaxID=2172015 RepID=A0ABW1I9K2_9PSEU
MEESDDPGSKDRIQSIERGFAVLLTFDAERTNPSLIEIANATGLSRPAVRRILLTLQHLGYVEPTTGSHWRLTPRVLTIGQHYATSSTIVSVSEPHMSQLVEETQESASLSALDGKEVVYLARVPAKRVLNVTAAAGTRVPAHATSMGRVLLAAASPEFVEDYLLDPGLQPLTPHTITDPDQFRDALDRVREQGWSLVSEERERGLIAVSAPIRDHTGQVVAALSSSSSTGRTSPGHIERYIVPVLTRIAKNISAELGG